MHRKADERLHDGRGAMALADALARHLLLQQQQQQQGASSSGGSGGGGGGTAAAGPGGGPPSGLGLTHAELLALAGIMSGATVGVRCSGVGRWGMARIARVQGSHDQRWPGVRTPGTKFHSGLSR